MGWASLHADGSGSSNRMENFRGLEGGRRTHPKQPAFQNSWTTHTTARVRATLPPTMVQTSNASKVWFDMMAAPNAGREGRPWRRHHWSANRKQEMSRSRPEGGDTGQDGRGTALAERAVGREQ